MAVPSFEGVLRGANVESLYFWVCEDVNHILGFAIEDFCDVVVCLNEGLYPWEVSQVCEKLCFVRRLALWYMRGSIFDQSFL